MNHRERYVLDYANAKLTRIYSNDLMQAKFKAESIAKISRAIDLYEKGFFTIDETTAIIAAVPN